MEYFNVVKSGLQISSSSDDDDDGKIMLLRLGNAVLSLSLYISSL